MIQVLKASKINKSSIDFNIENPNLIFLKELYDKLMLVTTERKAVGVAAPQIGVFYNIFSIGENMYINPIYTNLINYDKEIAFEGCLSVPGVQIPVERYKAIKAKYYLWNKETNSFTLKEEIMEGLAARCYQHEYSHLQGISIIDEGNLNRQDRRNFKKKF